MEFRRRRTVCDGSIWGGIHDMSHGLPSEGTRRIQIGLGLIAASGCVLAEIAVLILHGRPYWTGWWMVMVALIAGSFLLGRILTPLLEWIIAGYRGEA